MQPLLCECSTLDSLCSNPLAMSKYSDFFLLGKPEYQTIGDRLRLRKYGSWLAEEAWTREEQGRRRASFSLRAIELARKISKEKGISEDEAFESLQKADEDRDELFVEYSEEINAMMAAMPSNRDQFEELVTLFFQNRGQVKVEKKWESTEDWSVEDTRMLPQNFLTEIEYFMTIEDEVLDASDDEEEAPKEAT